MADKNIENAAKSATKTEKVEKKKQNRGLINSRKVRKNMSNDQESVVTSIQDNSKILANYKKHGNGQVLSDDSNNDKSHSGRN